VIKEGDRYVISISDIYYFESVDDRTFVYPEKEFFETRMRLYELEEDLKGGAFVRISKSVIVNLMKVVSIKPAMNGRFLCKLKNGEEVLISRKYVNDVRMKLKGERS